MPYYEIKITLEELERVKADTRKVYVSGQKLAELQAKVTYDENEDDFPFEMLMEKEILAATLKLITDECGQRVLRAMFWIPSLEEVDVVDFSVDTLKPGDIVYCIAHMDSVRACVEHNSGCVVYGDGSMTETHPESPWVQTA